MYNDHFLAPCFMLISCQTLNLIWDEKFKKLNGCSELQKQLTNKNRNRNIWNLLGSELWDFIIGVKPFTSAKIRTGKYVLISWVFDFRGSTAFRTFKKFPYKNHGKRLRLAANKWDWSEDQKHNYIFVWPKKQLEVSVHPTLCWEPEEKDIYNLSKDTLQNWYVFIYCNKHASAGLHFRKPVSQYWIIVNIHFKRYLRYLSVEI